MPKKSNELLASSIKFLLTSNIGFSIDLFSMLYIGQSESLEFVVRYEDPHENKDNEWEKIFSDVDEAINFFNEKRTELELGFDYEVELK